MIKIEMAPEADTSSEIGVITREYIWLRGMPWPVPEFQDNRVNRIEIFGPELDIVADFPGGNVYERDERGEVTTKVLAGLRSWKVKEARLLSTRLRALSQKVD